MGARVCLGCSTAYVLWLSRCPRCHGTDFEEAEEESVPKNTVHGGPTNKDAEPGEPGYVAPPDPADELIPKRDVPPGHVDVTPFDSAEPQYVELQEAIPGEPLPLVPDSAYPPDAQPLEEGDPPSAGSSSETSPEKPPTSDEKPPADPPKRARTTGNRSKRAGTGSSTARSTGGSGRATP